MGTATFALSAANAIATNKVANATFADSGNYATNALYAGTANTASNLTSGAAINLTNGFVTGSITNTFALTNGTYANLNVGTATFALSAANAIATNKVANATFADSGNYATNALYAGTANTASNLTAAAGINLTNGFVTGTITNTFALTNGTYANLNVGTATFALSAANAIATNKVDWATTSITASNALQLGGTAAANYSTSNVLAAAWVANDTTLSNTLAAATTGKLATNALSAETLLTLTGGTNFSVDVTALSATNSALGFVMGSIILDGLETNLVAWYKMDDNAASETVVDVMGYANGTAQQNTSVLHTNGEIGGALTFNGTSDYIDTGDRFTSILGSNFTISFWVKFRTERQIMDQTFLGVLYSASADPGGYLEVYNDLGKLEFAYVTPGVDNLNCVSDVVSPAGPTDWYYVAVILDQMNANTVRGRIYLNNALINTTTVSGVLPGTFGDPSFPGNPYIGVLHNGWGSNISYVNGYMDNFMIFKKALSAQEISGLYNYSKIDSLCSGDISQLNNDSGYTTTQNVETARTHAIATNKVSNASAADTATYAISTATATNAFQLGGIAAASFSTSNVLAAAWAANDTSLSNTLAAATLSVTDGLPTTANVETARINAIGTNVVAGVVTNGASPTFTTEQVGQYTGSPGRCCQLGLVRGQ